MLAGSKGMGWRAMAVSANTFVNRSHRACIMLLRTGGRTSSVLNHSRWESTARSSHPNPGEMASGAAPTTMSCASVIHPVMVDCQ
jgi:hypothetical protein